MEYRAPLKKNTVLAFDGMCCHIEDVIGQGTNSIVYKGWYEDHLNPELHHHVLVKELFPDHPQQKIYRAPDGSIVVEPEAQEIWQDHRQSFEIGNEIHLRLLHDHPDLMVMGGNLNSFSYRGTLYSVLGYTGGRNLKTELNKAGATLRLTVQRMTGILDGLEAFHKSGYLHLDISPGNIMLVGQGDRERIFLIDYNSAREQGSRSVGHMSRQEGFSPPEVRTGRSPDTLGYSTDLYSVAAVFYYSLMGRALTRNEILQRCPPDGRESPMLEGVPQTVRAMVSEILRKGLHAVPRKRYQSIGQMRRAFQELLDRIDCVGVTHWALWENGKKSVEELIRINPALGYLKDNKRLYPIRLGGERSETLEAYLGDLLSPDGKSGLLLAQGGMGKTTALLHTAMTLGTRYAYDSPAVFYISLNGWEKGDAHYIRSQILMGLRFKPEENTFDSAMHALHKLLEQPIKTKQGHIPGVLLLLDGLNEIRGKIAPLVQEIRELSQMAGVRILAASRSEVPELELETVKLSPLNAEDIETALGAQGLLIPQNQNVLQLLRTPLILSIYTQTGQNGKQVAARNEAELMKAYMVSLLEKELCQLPEDSPERWQCDAALNFVLPAIAAEIRKKGRGLTKRQLLKVVKNCKSVLKSWRMQKAFPQWIGHTGDIFFGTKKTDEWFDLIVHKLLWQRFGMLSLDANERYHIFHQNLSEYQAREYRTIASHIRISVNPATIVAVVWCVIQLLILWNQYESGLFAEVERVRFGGGGPYDGIRSVPFDETFSAVEAYLENPRQETYFAARQITKQTLEEIPGIFDFYEDIAHKERIFSFNERYETFDMEQLALSTLDELIFKLNGIDPQYMTEYFRGYIYSSAEEDTIHLICTLDVLTEYYHRGTISFEQITSALELVESIYQTKYDFQWCMDRYFYNADQEKEHRLEEFLQSLEEQFNAFEELEQSYPQEVQDLISKRTRVFRVGSAHWEDYTEEQIWPDLLPDGAVMPDWLPEESVFYSLVMDPVFLNITEDVYKPQNGLPGVYPLGFYTVCPGITRDQLYAYLDVLVSNNIASDVNTQSDVIQVFVSFAEMDVTIYWTQLQTVLVITGIHSGGSGA